MKKQTDEEEIVDSDNEDVDYKELEVDYKDAKEEQRRWNKINHQKQKLQNSA